LAHRLRERGPEFDTVPDRHKSHFPSLLTCEFLLFPQANIPSILTQYKAKVGFELMTSLFPSREEFYEEEEIRRRRRRRKKKKKEEEEEGSVFMGF
jgi:hypothetical protein